MDDVIRKQIRAQKRKLHELCDMGIELLYAYKSPEKVAALFDSPGGWPLITSAHRDYMDYVMHCVEHPTPEARTVAQVELTVDYDQSLQAAIAAGAYDWVHMGYDRWSFDGEVGTGTQKVTMYIEQYNRHVYFREIVAEFASRGLRPATLYELLAFGAQFPDVQRDQYPIFALGAVWPNEVFNEDSVSLLGCDRDRRMLDAGSHRKFTRICRFAAVAL